MTASPWIPAILAVALVGGGVWAGIDHEKAKVAQGAQAATISRLQAESDSGIRHNDSLAKITHTDTVQIIRWQTKYVTARDTLLKHDTTFVVRTYVQAADSTIHACQVLVSDCTARVAVLTRQHVIDDSIIGVYKAPAHRSLLQILRPKVGLGCAAGIGARGTPDAACGVTGGWTLF